MKECPLCHRCWEDTHDVCPQDGSPNARIFAGSCVLDGKYRLLQRLGEGGMGRVYKATHLGLDRLTAVKTLHRHCLGEDRFRLRFEREARALGRLEHPNIVAVTDFGVDPARQLPYLVMEHLEGLSLAQRLRSGGALGLDQALPIFAQVAAALDAAHRSGILHCDLKPANIFLLTKPGGDPRVKVLDFGLARFFFDPEETWVDGRGSSETATVDPDAVAAPSRASDRDEPTVEETPFGTPGYLAPEVLDRRPPTPLSDVYSLGAVVFATLVGQPPFPGPAAQRAAPHRWREPPRPSALRPGLDAGLDPPVLAALCRDPEVRPATARRLVAGLSEAGQRILRRRWWRREAPRRLSLSTLLGGLAALLLSLVQEPLQALENRLVDARFRVAPARPPHPLLVVVLIDDATLAADPQPLIARSEEVAATLLQAVAQGAVGVGIDLLLPEQWSRSPTFADLVLRHSETLALAAFSPLEGPVVGPSAVSGVAAGVLGPSRVERIFGFVNLDEDDDGVVRRGRAAFRDVLGNRRPSFAARVAQILLARLPRDAVPPPEGRYWIDFTLDWRRVERISWHHLAASLETEPERFRDRFVLVGADYAGSGDEAYRVPHPQGLPGEISGPLLQALSALTLLDGAPIREAPHGRTLFLAGFVAAAGAAALLLIRRLPLAGAVAIAAAAVWVAAAFALFLHGRILLPVSSFLAAHLTSIVIAAAARRQLPFSP